MPISKLTTSSLKGFTLVELLVAIAIIAVIAAVAIPNLRKFNDSQIVQNYATQLLSDLRKVQSNAQSGVNCPSGSPSTSWKITINTSAPSYTTTCLTSPSSSPDPSTSTTALSGTTVTTSQPGSSPAPSCLPDLIFTKTTVSQNCTINITGSGTTRNISITSGGTIN